MSEKILEIDNLETHYGKIHALRGISLSVETGRIVTLLGANGAGKSTTLRSISGLIRATSGTIRDMGENITRTPAVVRSRPYSLRPPMYSPSSNQASSTIQAFELWLRTEEIEASIRR